MRPRWLRCACRFLGDDSHAVHELQESVQGVLNRLHNWDSDRNQSQILALVKDLDNTRRELAGAMSELRQMRSSETDKVNLDLGNYAGTPQAIAERISSEKPAFEWLQAFAPRDEAPPLDNDTALELLSLIEQFPFGAESHSHRKLPDDEAMPRFERLAELVKREQSLTSQLDQIDARTHPSFARLSESKPEARTELKEALRHYLWEFDLQMATPDDWSERVLLDVVSEKHGIWQHLHDATREKCTRIEAKIASVSDLKITGAEGHEPTTCRLRAVEFADPPADIGCYKLLSFVHFADSPLPANRYPYIPDYAPF
jgi:hypothetical protein